MSLYDRWAPRGARWSPWVKPVLFATAAGRIPGSITPVKWVEKSCFSPLLQSGDPYREVADAIDAIAIIVDLPGADGVWVGAELSQIGFRPVPLYNAVPHDKAVVDVRPIAYALADAASSIAAPLDAPPAFLLDRERMALGRVVEPPIFDNRARVHASDFPSHAMMTNAGIRHVVVIRDASPLSSDLHPVLRPWQSLWQLRAGASVVEPLALPGRLTSWLTSLQWYPRREDGSFGIWKEERSSG